LVWQGTVPVNSGAAALRRRRALPGLGCPRQRCRAGGAAVRQRAAPSAGRGLRALRRARPHRGARGVM